MSLEHKVAVVTGGATGIGLAIVRELALRGAQVIIVGRRRSKLDEAVASVGKNVSAYQADVSKPAELDTLFERVRDMHGKLDILVASAGGGEVVPFTSITEEHFDNAFSTNVKGVLFTIQKALPLLVPGSSVIVIGSTSSIETPPGMSLYGASKAALRSLVRGWISEIRGSGIRINVLSPGPVDTQAMRDTFPGKAEEVIAYLVGKSPLGRIGAPEEIGRIAAFLAGEDSSYIHGVELFADGGASQI